MTLNFAFHSDSSLAGGFGGFDDDAFSGGWHALFLRNDHGEELGGGGMATAAPMPAFPPLRTPANLPALRKRPRWVQAINDRVGDFDFAPDLGASIGTRTWYRGAATCVGLCALTWLLAPGMEHPLYGEVPAALTGADWDAARAQAIRPLGQGASTGYRVAATNLVAPLTDTPERPIINLDAKLASGDGLLGVLQRSGVGKTDASAVGALVTKAVALGEIEPGTTLDLTLGRRSDKGQPRPLEKLAFRAKFDLKLEVARGGGGLSLRQIPIAIDRTPLRIQGLIGSSLYRSARAAGAPAKAVESYIKTIASRVPVSHLGSGCKFDIIVGQARAETGEVQLGNLMYAGLTGCANKVQLLPWETNGKMDWFDGIGRGQGSGVMAMPAAGRFSSGFGMRRHPILGFVRMHKGVDIAAPYGSPVYAATDGTVQFAGRASGYGNLIKLNHGNGFGTGYGHLSRILVHDGQQVRKGQQIGAIGNTGLSTGPHLHYEMYKNGMAVNPRSVSFSVERKLDAGALAAFRAKLSQMMAVPLGHGAQHDDAD